MIPRYQRVLLWVLLLVSAVMAIFLIRLRERASDKLQAAADAVPLTPPSAMPASDVTLMLANDTDGSLVNTDRPIALPTEPHARARYLLNQLLAEYAKPGSAHPIAANAGVDDVFLMPLPAGTTVGTLAVVNLSSGLLQALARHAMRSEPPSKIRLARANAALIGERQIQRLQFGVHQAADTPRGLAGPVEHRRFIARRACRQNFRRQRQSSEML